MTKAELSPPHPGRIAFLGTYVPRRCGIATFTADLSGAVAAAAPRSEVWAVAMNDQTGGHRYPHRVKFEIKEKRRADYRLAAEFLNMSDVSVLSLQHEYGIFGGPDGRYVLELVRRLRLPVVTTLHTVLREPTPGQRSTLRELAAVSDRLVVMAERAIEFLHDIYGVPSSQVEHIPHGIPDRPFVDPNYYKDKFGVEGRRVILTFGLLSPGKGIESMIEALPLVTERYPDAVYVVLGATHPHVQATMGQEYRTKLQTLAEDLGVSANVVFHNRFVELDELCEFLGAADVYVTPYLSEAQIVSGTLAYALGTGNAVVSTPYWYAQEMLAEGRGRLVPPRDPQALADGILALFDNEVERHAIRKRAYQYTRDFVWSQVASRYLDLFAAVAEQPPRSEVQSPVRLSLDDGHGELDEIDLAHLRTMTDDTGIYRHAVGTVPTRSDGYSTDDNARALVVAQRARPNLAGGAGCTMLINRYLSFLHHAFDADTGCFRNHMTYDRRWAEGPGSEDAHGRCVWALGEAVALTEREGHAALAVRLFHASLPAMRSFTHPRVWAYGLLGIHAYLSRYEGQTDVRRVRDDLTARLHTLYRESARPAWPWFESAVTYDNARLPQALLLAGQGTEDEAMVADALRALDWLWQISSTDKGMFQPVGNDGWYAAGGTRADFDQMPIEAAAMIEACLAAHAVTGQRRWFDRARRCFNWFLGDNQLRLPLYEPGTGGCSNGLHAHGVSENRGAEATLSWLLSLLAFYDAPADGVQDRPLRPKVVDPLIPSPNLATVV